MKISMSRKIFATPLAAGLVVALLQMTPSAFATPTYTQEVSVTTSTYGFLLRTNGYIFVKSANNKFKQLNETTGSLIREVTMPRNISDQIIVAGTNIVGFFGDGSMWKMAHDGMSVMDATWAGRPCGNMTNLGNGFSSNGDFVLVTCFEYAQANARTIHLFDIDLLELANATVSGWSPGKSVMTSNSAYIANLNSPYDTKKLSIAALNTSPYTALNRPNLAISLTSISTSFQLSSTPTNLKFANDANTLWAISGGTGDTYKLVKLAFANDTIATTTLTDYPVGSTWTFSNISLVGTTLYMASIGNKNIVALDTTDLTSSSIATITATNMWGMEGISNGFWVSTNTAAMKYSFPVAISSSDSSAEEFRKRQAAIDSARNALVAKIKAGETIVNSDFIAADVTQFNSDLAKRANAEFQVAAKSKSFSFADVKTIINKWTIYQDIQHGVRSNVTGRLAYQAGIIPSSVKMKQTLIAQVMNTDASERSSVEKIDALIAELAKKQSDQENRKVTIINKITSRK